LTNGGLKTIGFVPQTHNITHNQKNTKNTTTMIPPARRLPAASIEKLSKFAICRAINLDFRKMVM
jgi:hypothetical protein